MSEMVVSVTDYFPMIVKYRHAWNFHQVSLLYTYTRERASTCSALQIAQRRSTQSLVHIRSYVKA